jgi:site-specific DNA-methyltransferase (adenine-specific)
MVTKNELLETCKKLGIKGCSSKNKITLQELIKNFKKEEPQQITYEKGQVTFYEGDCMSQLDNVEDKSIQTICIDPPYNIGKAEWDNIPNYIEWLVNVIKKLKSKMKNNGSMFIFHNDMEQIAELMIKIKEETNLIFRQMITWNKRFEGSNKKGFLDGFVVKNEMHNWNKMAEYILFYTFDNTEIIKETRIKKGIKALTISEEIKSKSGGITGWYSNIETGKNFPTQETMVPITKHLGINYEDIVPKFRNLKTHHSVWNYDMAPRNEIHITPKPLDLLENIILHTSDPGDLLLDCFAGSGSFGYACSKTGRNCILIEKDPNYSAFIRKSLNSGML